MDSRAAASPSGSDTSLLFKASAGLGKTGSSKASSNTCQDKEKFDQKLTKRIIFNYKIMVLLLNVQWNETVMFIMLIRSCHVCHYYYLCPLSLTSSSSELSILLNQRFQACVWHRFLRSFDGWCISSSNVEDYFQLKVEWRHWVYKLRKRLD